MEQEPKDITNWMISEAAYYDVIYSLRRNKRESVEKLV